MDKFYENRFVYSLNKCVSLNHILNEKSDYK